MDDSTPQDAKQEQPVGAATPSKQQHSHYPLSPPLPPTPMSERTAATAFPCIDQNKSIEIGSASTATVGAQPPAAADAQSQHDFLAPDSVPEMNSMQETPQKVFAAGGIGDAHIRSNWDKLPAELKDEALARAGPLTQFLCGRIAINPKRQNYRLVLRSIWLDVFDLDWQGDLAVLPSIDRDCILNSDLRRVKSRSMYERLCAMLPMATESNTWFAHADDCFDRYAPSISPSDDANMFGDNTLVDIHSNGTTETLARRKNPCLACDINAMHPQRILVPLRLIHVAMQHMWMADIVDSDPGLLKYPVATAYRCVVGGHARLLQYLSETGALDLSQLQELPRPVGSHERIFVMDLAARYNHIDVLEVMRAAGCQCTLAAMDDAVSGGHVDAVRWLCKNQPHTASAEAMNTASREGRMAILLAMHDAGVSCTTRAMDGAARAGHLHVVKWLHENRNEGCTTAAMDNAAISGHFDIVRWLHLHRKEGCTTNAMDGTAWTGHFDILKWLHENRTEGCTVKAMDKAARFGRLDIVQWLHRHRTEGCTTNAMDDAAASGSIKTLQWLHHNRTEGCTVKAIDNAAASNVNAHEIVSWLLEHRTEGFTSSAINNAVSSEVVKLLMAHVKSRPDAEARTKLLYAQAVGLWHLAAIERISGNHSYGFQNSKSGFKY